MVKCKYCGKNKGGYQAPYHRNCKVVFDKCKKEIFFLYQSMESSIFDNDDMMIFDAIMRKYKIGDYSQSKPKTK